MNGRLTVIACWIVREAAHLRQSSHRGDRTFPHVFLPFKVSANLPSGGSLKLDGTAGPIDASNAAATPLQAKVTIQQMNLATSGFIDPASGISGIADFDGTVTSDGKDAKTSATVKVDKLQVAAKGSPAGNPVEVKYTVSHNLLKQAGTLSQGDIAMGKAVAHLTGVYDAHGATTSINMKLNGQGMPVDDLEAMLPALGVVLLRSRSSRAAR